MTVGARSDDAGVVRAGYALLRALRDELVAAGTQTATELSMGMSGDLELAIAEGATLVRVGQRGLRRPTDVTPAQHAAPARSGRTRGSGWWRARARGAR